MHNHFIDKLIIDESNLKTLTDNKLKVNAFTVFKNTFMGQMWNSVRANWLMLMFLIPLVLWVTYAVGPQSLIDSRIPYSGNLGIGYPIIDYSYQMGLNQDFYMAMQKALIMFPLIIVASVGLAGVFNVIKYNAWGIQVKLVKTFFKGIKNSFAPFVFMGMLIGLVYVLFVFCGYFFDVYALSVAFKIIALVILSLIAIFVGLLCVYVFPQAVVFDLSIWAMLKNAVLLSYKFIVQSLFIAIAGLLSALLLFVTFGELLQLFAMMLFFMGAFSYTACVWTSFTHGVFEIIGESLNNAPTIVVQPQQTNQQKAKKPQKKAYQNPKKGKTNKG